jgi:hypothetical protein
MNEENKNANAGQSLVEKPVPQVVGFVSPTSKWIGLIVIGMLIAVVAINLVWIVKNLL